MGRGASWADRIATIALVLFVGGPLLGHVQLVSAFTGFKIFGLGGLLSLVALVFSIVHGFRVGFGAAARPLIMAAVPTAVFVLAAMGGGKVPRINDITTDTEHPPQFVNAGTLAANRGRDMAYPPEFVTEQRNGYPNLQPLALPIPPDDAFKRVETAARQMSTWEVTRVDPTARALEGFDTTYLFRFQDDFVIEVHPVGVGSIVQMRSKPRVGKGDVGANAARIEAFFAKLH